MAPGSFFNNFLHFGHGNGRQVLGKQDEKKEKQTKSAEHDAVFYQTGRIKTPGIG
jgi:hypothetical protein